MNPDGQLEPVHQDTVPEDAAEARILRVYVDGMGCPNCATRVRNSLLALAGVVSADVDWEQGLAFVDYVPSRATVDTILAAVTAAGNDGYHRYRGRLLRQLTG